MNVITTWAKNFWKDEEGLGTLEILLIVAVLVGVALLFREKIFEWVEKLLGNIDTPVEGFDPTKAPEKDGE